MRKTSITLDESQLEFLHDAIHAYYEQELINADKNGLAGLEFKDTFFGHMDDKIYAAMERCWKKPKNDIYEMTGGYLGDGVCITEDGHLYQN
jgi:hypothetical protein